MPEEKIDSHLWGVMHEWSPAAVTSSGLVNPDYGLHPFMVLVEFYDEGNLNKYGKSVEFSGAKIISRDRLQPILKILADKNQILEISNIEGVAKLWYDATARST